MTLHIHQRIDASSVNGPGQRAVIWVQGCSLACADCWNPATHSVTRGRVVNVASLAGWVQRLWSCGEISGLTISGGEPMEQALAVAELLKVVRTQSADLSIGMFSGYSEGELRRGLFRTLPSAATGEDNALLWQRIRHCLDFAVLGRYNRLQPSHRPLVTSGNQRLRLLTNRHSFADFDSQCVEITIGTEGLTQITGFPILGIPFASHQ